MDRTDYSGPFGSEAEALAETMTEHEVCENGEPQELDCGHHGSMMSGAGFCTACDSKDDRDAWLAKVNASAFLRGYVDCLIWTGMLDTADGSGDSIPEGEIDREDVAFRLPLRDLAEIISDCEGFQDLARETLEAIEASGTGPTTECSFEEYSGHNFCLTRNRHGTGFWDRGYPADLADKVTKDSQSFGEHNLMMSVCGSLMVG